ncbi:hypothetical protein PGTUg99_028563 [Puccinia graminis f. sp. tritici]|uniref:Uncharacterized protein n=1 Tax=Puccinia graminis f. sp. tritici TaxID=56615 RepID=A0A5B0R8U8_PUCGR|nr:hypothetical protein PGTUg99_028563 [Puccinia graminis f. sp. tritici]
MEPENEPIGPPQEAHVQTSRFRWETDGINGGPPSMRILLDWLSSQDNWQRWVGFGVTRRILAEEILQVMRSHGINHRHRVAVIDMVHQLHLKYKMACKNYWLRTSVDPTETIGEGECAIG